MHFSKNEERAARVPEPEYDYILGMQDLCSILGVIPTTIRYYDEHKVISTRRLENGYRFFFFNDLIQCLKMKGYSNLGMPTETAGKLTLRSSLDQVTEEVDRFALEKERELERLKLQLDYLQEEKKLLSVMESLEGNYVTALRPGLYWLPCQKEGKVLRDQASREIIRRWSSYAPFAEPCPIMNRDLSESSTCDLGYCIREKYAAVMTEEDREKAVYFGEEKCILTLIHANVDIMDYYSVLKPALDYLKQENLTLAGDILSILVASNMKTPWRPDTYNDYYFCYFPAK